MNVLNKNFMKEINIPRQQMGFRVLGCHSNIHLYDIHQSFLE